MGDGSIWQLVGVLVALTGLITASSVYFLRKNTERIEQSNKELFSSMKESHNELKNDVKQLTVHLDERIDKMHQRMDMNNGELKEYIAHEVGQLKAKDADQDLKLESMREKLSQATEEHLKFKLEVSEKYEKKSK